MIEGTKPENAITVTNSVTPLSEHEHRSLVTEYNNSAAPYPAAKTIVELFEAQVARTPNAEAIRLGRLLDSLMPDCGESIGLLALMLLQESRRAARVTSSGACSVQGSAKHWASCSCSAHSPRSPSNKRWTCCKASKRRCNSASRLSIG